MAGFITIKKELKKKASLKRAKTSQLFFKTGKGEYAEGDVFIGVSVPEVRRIAKKYTDLSFPHIKKLLQSKIHEDRLVALLIVVEKFEKEEGVKKKEVYDFYIQSTRYINNWDLVDLSAYKIIGPHLLKKPKSILYKLARSKNMWERRIAIVATYHFIKNDLHDDTLKIAKILLGDEHNLIHKAVGWMVREVGNRSLETEEEFLKNHYQSMPRTMLRCAIEKFPEAKRKKYLKGVI